MEHRRYVSEQSYVEGMTFYALRDKRWVVNYPKEHYKNGASKSRRTGDRYKRTVRMFKNARNYLETNHAMSSKLVPSYFAECLLYNAPDTAFHYGFSGYLLRCGQLDGQRAFAGTRMSEPAAISVRTVSRTVVNDRRQGFRRKAGDLVEQLGMKQADAFL